MKHWFLLSLLVLFTALTAESQILKGKITDKSGKPVQYATVFIQELRQGTTTNTKGDYEIKIPAGKYLVICQSLGYEPVIMNITLTTSTITRDIVLQEQFYEIPEVRISASGEDPAYSIMRKVIGLAPYYLNNISHYKSEVYLKGNLFVRNIPGIMKRAMKAEARNSSTGKSYDSNTIKEGDSYLMESFNEIEYNAPDRYIQKVISYNSTFPEEGNEISPMEYIQASFYQPVLVEMAISPLSPQAFSHYNFKYLGATAQGNYTVDKIEVRPKRKSQQLFEGTLYIIEDLWCLHSVDLSNENIVGKIRVEQVYIPVEEDIWMPVSHKFSVNIAIIGFKADAGYVSSVKYMEVTPNRELQKPDPMTGVYGVRGAIPDSSTSKNKQQIEKILQKEELTNRDMIRLSKLMEKESAATVKDTIRNKLEVDTGEKTSYIIEKDAGKKDSAYWAEIRPVPLSDIELKSLSEADSSRLQRMKEEGPADTTGISKTKKRTRFGRAINDIAFGHTWNMKKGLSFNYGGLADIKNLSFNTVDGFIYGMDFRITKTFTKGRSISLYPDIRYAFSRENIMWRVNGNYSAKGIKNRQLFFRAGMTSRDFGSNGGINPLINSITTLFREINHMKLYESEYFTLGFRSEPANGLKIEYSGTYENRLTLENNTTYSLIKTSREYTQNIPDNPYLGTELNQTSFPENMIHYDFVTNVTFTPEQRYSISNNTRIPRGSDWPTFGVTWKHGVNKAAALNAGYKHFDMVRFEISRRSEPGPFSEFRWKVRTGGFINSSGLSYYDFTGFNPQPVRVLLDDYDDSFKLPAYYSLDTPDFFGEIHLKYTTPYFLLKLLPGLSNTLMRENLSLSYLGTRGRGSYTEAGYSMSQIFFLGEIGIYAGFDDLKYRQAGIKIILNIN